MATNGGFFLSKLEFIYSELELKNWKLKLETVKHFTNYIWKLYKARKLKLATKRYIERCFEYVIRTTEFLDLKYEHLKSILKSSKLNITTELSVLNAIDVWVKHRIDERSTFIMDLLPKVRLQLLPIVTLNELKLSKDYFYNLERFSKYVDKVIKKKKNKTLDCNSYDRHRFNNQNCCSILSITGIFKNKTTSKTFEIDIENCEKYKELPPLKVEQEQSTLINIQGSLYVLGGNNNNQAHENVIQKYTPGFSDGWEVVYYLPPYEDGYSVCSFVDKILVLEAKLNEFDQGRCFCIDHVTYESRDIPYTNQERQYAACTAFKDKVYVFGGWSYEFHENANDHFKTVEVFDPDLNKWSFAAEMFYSRYRLKVVAVREKIFVFGGRIKFNFEVFDVLNNCFTLLPSPNLKHPKNTLPFNAVLVGSKVLIYFIYRNHVFIFDTNTTSFNEISVKKKNFSFKYSCCAIQTPKF